MFRTKAFVEIIGSMLSQARAVQRRVTDYNVGGVARTLLEAPAHEIDQLYQEMVQGLVEGIPTAIYRSFEFDKRPAQYANGILRITVRPGHNAPVVIPVAFLATSATGQKYQTVEGGTIAVGATSIDLLAAAVDAGPAGNVSAGAISRAVTSGLGVIDVTNPEAFSSGRGEETEAERKLRFRQFVKSLARGTPASLRYIARQDGRLLNPLTGAAVEQVVRVQDAETTGFVTIYIHNGVGNTSAALVRLVQKLIDGYYHEVTGDPVDGYAPAGMRVDVRAMTETVVPASIEVDVPLALQTEALKEQIRAACRSTIRSIASGSRLRPLDLINAAVALDPVDSAVIDAPLVIVPCPVSAVLVPGEIVVTWRQK
jgi:uncharacterized phage protein gp47/JayE